MALMQKFGFRRLKGIVKHRRISEANGNALIEFKIPAHDEKSWRNPHLHFRVLHVTWHDKNGEKETVIPVPRLARQFGDECPDNTNDCEQVRRWTLNWPKEVVAVAET
jgi:hypothetical protein